MWGINFSQDILNNILKQYLQAKKNAFVFSLLTILNSAF